jgi:hypothetical protein
MRLSFCVSICHSAALSVCPSICPPGRLFPAQVREAGDSDVNFCLSGCLSVFPAQVREVGDGNINFVFILESPSGGSLCVKQGHPYVRIIKSWRLTQVPRVLPTGTSSSPVLSLNACLARRDFGKSFFVVEALFKLVSRSCLLISIFVSGIVVPFQLG